MIILTMYIVVSALSTTSSTTLHKSWDECTKTMEKVIAQNAMQDRLAYGQCKEQRNVTTVREVSK